MRASGLSRLLSPIIIAVSWALLVYPPMPVYTLLADSEQYRASAETILSLDFFAPVSLSSSPHLATVMRPPLFPLLVALARLNPLLNYPASLIALHALIALALMTTAPFALRRLAPPAATALCMGVALYSAKQMLWAETSEFLALSLLLASTISFLSWMYRPTRSSALITALALSFAALTRSALLPFLFLVPFMGSKTPQPHRRGVLVALSLGLVPLLLWCAAQYHRVGVFSIGAYEGLNLLATARSLGTLPSSPEDSPETLQFISLLNERGVTASDQAISPTNTHLWDGEFYAAFHHNFDLTCVGVRDASPGAGLSTTPIAIRAVSASPTRYLAFLQAGVVTLVRDYLPLLLSSLATAVWLRRRSARPRPLATAGVVVCCLSFLYLSMIFATMLWLPRYFLPVQPTIILVLGLCAFNLIASFREESPR